MMTAGDPRECPPASQRKQSKRAFLYTNIHHFIIMLSLLIKILKIDNFGDFSCDFDDNSRADVFRDVISHIINQW